MLYAEDSMEKNPKQQRKSDEALTKKKWMGFSGLRGESIVDYVRFLGSIH